MVKLTPAQMDLLSRSSHEIGASCTDQYGPMQALRQRGLVSVVVSKYGRCTVKATDAGRAALAEGGAK